MRTYFVNGLAADVVEAKELRKALRKSVSSQLKLTLASAIGSSPSTMESQWIAAETKVKAVTAFPATGFAGTSALEDPMLGVTPLGSLGTGALETSTLGVTPLGSLGRATSWYGGAG